MLSYLDFNIGKKGKIVRAFLFTAFILGLPKNSQEIFKKSEYVWEIKLCENYLVIFIKIYETGMKSVKSQIKILITNQIITASSIKVY